MQTANQPTSLNSDCTSVSQTSWYKHHTWTHYGKYPLDISVTCISGSSVGIATTLFAGLFGDQIHVGVRFSASVQIGPGVHPASCKIGTGSFPGVKQSGRSFDHLPHLVRER
jgi:hypothetical protein